MPKIIFLSDTHLGFDYPLRPKKEKRRRGIDFFNNFDKALEYAQELQADLVIHGGDLFFRTLVPPTIIDMVYERIFNFAESGIPIVIVPGNHESSRLPVSLFMQHPLILYFSKPEVFQFRLKGIDFDMAGFPCVRKEVLSKFPDIAKEIAPKLRKESIKLLCMHQSIEGATCGPSDYTFRGGKDVILIQDLPEDYDLFLSGHIHRSQILYSACQTPIIYPGSIERTAFAEKDETKGFYEINISESQEISYEFIPLETRPMIDIFLDKNLYTAATLKEDILQQITNLPSDSILRFKLKNNAFIKLLNVRFLDGIISPTMNYQIAGLRSLTLKNKTQE
ncbi:DNA repair exonuclease [Lentimicrobium sp. L6]|uniref:metallophosphoesterase family protein n=1 Tax=Lentimicrobium sp. L6 TaxID=2735916 RepID=UPI001556413C|nr:DNA repair exonuclease [Lentimicrobium sp. L6]NPD84108.1 DNA repair exonuclease [Lentimicrobium sp. L6]